MAFLPLQIVDATQKYLIPRTKEAPSKMQNYKVHRKHESENPEEHPNVVPMGKRKACLPTKHPSLPPGPLHPSGALHQDIALQAQLQSFWPPYCDYVSLSSFM